MLGWLVPYSATNESTGRSDCRTMAVALFGVVPSRTGHMVVLAHPRMVKWAADTRNEPCPRPPLPHTPTISLQHSSHGSDDLLASFARPEALGKGGIPWTISRRRFTSWMSTSSRPVRSCRPTIPGRTTPFRRSFSAAGDFVAASVLAASVASAVSNASAASIVSGALIASDAPAASNLSSSEKFTS